MTATIEKGNAEVVADDGLKEPQKTMETAEDSNDGGDADHGHGHGVRSGQGWGRGIVADVKRTLGTHWKGEMINLNGKTVACAFFLYFACIAPAVTFGAIYGKATNNNIGAVEMIAATAWCGIVYAVAGGQPMMINGGTGPVLAFTEILYKISKSMDVPFLTLNAWIGIWVVFYMLLAAVVDLNRFILLCTRFTDEIFSFLIALIFIINAVGSPFSSVGVAHYFNMDHKSHDLYEDQPYYSHWSSALLSLIVFLGTTQLAIMLRKFKFSPFLPSQMFRNAMTDFAVVISILVWSLIGNAFPEIPIEKLNVPSAFAPTFQCCDAACQTSWPNDCYGQLEPYGYRSWFVDLGNLNGKAWVPFMAAGPALLAFILVFLDDGITWHLINHPSHKLKHGDAYNYDTIIIGLMVLVNSLFGLPWLVAATVRSLNHVHAMAEKSPSGEILSVHETRLSGLGIHALCLATVFALDVLKLIPVPVLYGVFLFMGLMSLGTNQFWGRMLMFFMQPSKYPVQPYTQYMKARRMHLFTLIQLFFFALLYAVKSIKSIAIAFPILIAACIPVRLYLMPWIFTEDELILIDSDPNVVKVWIENRQAQEQEPLIEPDDAEHGSKDDTVEEGAPVSPVAQPSPVAKPSPRAARSPRSRRTKTMSCPTGALIFSEEPSALGPRWTPRLVEALPATIPEAQNEESTHSTDTFEGMDLATPMPSKEQQGHGRRPRPSREERRSLSCPVPNMFFEVGMANSGGAAKQTLPILHEAP